MHQSMHHKISGESFHNNVSQGLKEMKSLGNDTDFQNRSVGFDKIMNMYFNPNKKSKKSK